MKQIREYSQFKVGLIIDLTKTPYEQLNELTIAITKLYRGWNSVQDALGGVIPPIHCMFKEVHEYTCSRFWDMVKECYNIPVNDIKGSGLNMHHNITEGTLEVVELPDNHGLVDCVTLEELRIKSGVINGGGSISLN
jgi:hypothetical protein